MNPLEKMTDSMSRGLIEKMSKPKKYLFDGQLEIHQPASGEGDGVDMLEALRDGKAIVLACNDIVRVIYHFANWKVPLTSNLQCTTQDGNIYFYIIDGKDEMQGCIDHYKIRDKS